MRSPLFFILLFFAFNSYSQKEYKPHITILSEWNYTVFRPVKNNYLVGLPDFRLGALYHSETSAVIGASYGLLNNDFSLYLGYTFQAPKIFKKKTKKIYPKL